jgi:hypothetical protein
MVEALISPKPYERVGTSTPSTGVRVRLPPPVPMSSLPVFALPRTVSTTLPGGSTLLHSSLPGWTGKLDSQSLVTGKPGGEKMSALRVSSFTVRHIAGTSILYDMSTLKSPKSVTIPHLTLLIY